MTISGRLSVPVMTGEKNLLFGGVDETLPVVRAGEKSRNCIFSTSGRWFGACSNEFDLTIAVGPGLLGVLVIKTGENNLRNGAENTVMAPLISLVPY